MTLQFFVAGHAKPSGSKTGFPIYRGKAGHKEFTGHVAMADASKGAKDWKRTVAMEAKRRFPRYFLGPLRVILVFALQRPKSHFGTGKNASVLKESAPRHHTQKPDVDKLSRAVLDACTGIVWKDDAQVCRKDVFKAWAYPGVDEPGVNITVEELG